MSAPLIPNDKRPIVIITDAWEPQVNGVVRTLKTVGAHLRARGYRVAYITPLDYRSIPAPSYPEIRLSMTHWLSLGKRLKAMNPLAVHIATEGPLGLAARVHCVRRGIPFTTSFHTKFPEYFAQRWHTPISWGYAFIRWFHKYSRGVLVPTKSMAEELHSWRLTNTAPWTRGVDHTVFSPHVDLHLVPQNLPRPIATYVGRVAVEKNLEAFLKLDLPGTKMVVGDGPARAALEQKFPDAVFTGAKFGDELSAHFAASDVFVFPSKTDTFGLVVIEALASGLPVAAYPVPGPQDILAGADGAGFVDEDLGRAIAQAYQGDKAAARAHAQKFTWDRCTDLFLDNLSVINAAA